MMKKTITMTLLTGAVTVLSAIPAFAETATNEVTLPNSSVIADSTADQVDFTTLYNQDQASVGKSYKLLNEDGSALTLDGKNIEVVLKSGEKRTVTVDTKRGTYRLSVQEKDGKAYLIGLPQLVTNVHTNKPKTGWVKTSDGKLQYLRGGEHLPAGWANLEGKWYFFDPDGNVKQTGWEFINGKWYYLSPVSGAMKTGWLYNGGHWYYLTSSGAMAIGWEFVNNQWYYLDQSGAMKSSTWFQVNGKWYFVDTTGALVTNSVVDGYRVNANGEWVS